MIILKSAAEKWTTTGKNFTERIEKWEHTKKKEKDANDLRN